MFYARQGDLDIKSISSLPKSLKEGKSKIIAFGEATGHHHKLVELDIETQLNTYLDELNKQVYFEVKGGRANLTHQEHKTVILDPGVYRVDTERTYDYFTETITQVKD